MFGMLVYGNDSRGSSMSRRFMFTAFFSIAVAIVSMNGQCENSQPRSSKFDSSYLELEIVPHHESPRASTERGGQWTEGPRLKVTGDKEHHGPMITEIR